MNQPKVIESTEACGICGRVIVHSLDRHPQLGTCQTCCGQRVVLTEREVPSETQLAGFALGDRVEADLYRGGRQDNDGITRGAQLVTKVGIVGGISDVLGGAHVSLYVDFDDGDLQVMFTSAENGAKPGYPTAAFRRLYPRGLVAEVTNA